MYALRGPEKSKWAWPNPGHGPKICLSVFPNASTLENKPLILKVIVLFVKEPTDKSQVGAAILIKKCSNLLTGKIEPKLVSFSRCTSTRW